ncbi:MAG: hypothetical protein QOI61_1075 [Actinomycetota bacterium]|jgi:hypothetical protein
MSRSEPTPEVMAVIVAAVEAAWPRPVIASSNRRESESPSWRFSGRSWNAPVAANRNRPKF